MNFNFLPIPKSLRSFHETAHIGKNGMTITTALYQRMGEPTAVSFHFDDDAKALGIKCEEAINSRSVAVKKSGSAYRVCNATHLAKFIAKQIGVNLDKQVINLHRGIKDGDFYIFEMANAEVLNKLERKTNGK